MSMRVMCQFKCSCGAKVEEWREVMWCVNDCVDVEDVLEIESHAPSGWVECCEGHYRCPACSR